MTDPRILAAIPHRPPFLLVDEIVEWHESRIVCRKTWRQEEYFFAGHYPGQPIVPGVLLCESAMQAGAVLLSRHVAQAAAGVPVATRIADVRFKQMVRPGQTTRVEVVLKERLATAYFLEAKVMCGGKAAARLEFACTLATT
jgi:3-hydroxyacyl-[acyl-carrier-protein] dehydratase